MSARKNTALPPNIQLDPRTGQPFVTEAAATKYLRTQQLDPAMVAIIPFEGGWALRSEIGAPLPSAPVAPPAAAAPSTGPAELPTGTARIGRLFWVRFSGMADPNVDHPDVHLIVNGVIRLAKRGVPTIFRGEHLCAIDDAVHNVYRKMPGEPRQIIGQVKTYPYETLREASEQEYEAMLKSGNEMRDAQMAGSIAAPVAVGAGG
jgi:hypothetical protein